MEGFSVGFSWKDCHVVMSHDNMNTFFRVQYQIFSINVKINQIKCLKYVRNVLIFHNKVHSLKRKIKPFG